MEKQVIFHFFVLGKYNRCQCKVQMFHFFSTLVYFLFLLSCTFPLLRALCTLERFHAPPFMASFQRRSSKAAVVLKEYKNTSSRFRDPPRLLISKTRSFVRACNAIAQLLLRLANIAHYWFTIWPAKVIIVHAFHYLSLIEPGFWCFEALTILTWAIQAGG